jgi:hypothetical protein
MAYRNDSTIYHIYGQTEGNQKISSLENITSFHDSNRVEVIV